MKLWLLIIGVISILGQVVLLRELNVAFFGSELIYILALGLWLLWTATGAAVGRRAYLPSARGVSWLLIGFAIVLPLTIVFARGVRVIFGAVPGAYLPFPTQMLAMALALLPVGILLGLLFQWAAKLYVGQLRTLAVAYAIESVGGLVGGVLATIFLALGVSNLAAGLVCALLGALAAIMPLRRQGMRIRVVVALLAIGVLGLCLVTCAKIDRRLTSWNHPQLLASRDTPYGRVTISVSSGQLAVFNNDALAYESEGTATEEFVHLAMLQHAAPETVLVVGGVAAGLMQEVPWHRPKFIEYVELNPGLLDLLQDAHSEIGKLQPTGVVPAHDRRTTFSDPRRFLTRERPYDVILVAMPDPDSGQANRYYTRDFFAQCARNLAPEGVLAFRMRGAENLWTPQLTRRAASIHRALHQVFSFVTVLPGAMNIFLASQSPLPVEPGILAVRLAEREIPARLVSLAYLNYVYTNDRFAEVRNMLSSARAPANTDARPICYQYTLLLWLAQFFPVLGWLDIPYALQAHWWRSLWFWLLVGLAMMVLLLLRRFRTSRSAVTVGLAGGVGMVLETALILNYQVRSGVLYQDLGLLLTLFMAGLALGAAVLALTWRLMGGASRGFRRLGFGLWLAFAGLNLLSAWLLAAGFVSTLATTGVLLLACGYLVAAIFAHVSLQGRQEQRLVVSPLYAADLIGGCLGSVLATLFLIPVLGLTGAAIGAVAVCLAAYDLRNLEYRPMRRSVPSSAGAV